MLKSGKLRKTLFLIFVLALTLRLYRLGEIPVGFHADEVRVGWNAYSILKTGADDWGKRLGLYYNTFGDFRPSGIFYLTAPVVAVFGMSEFAVRLPAALLGALTVIPLYFLVKALSKKEQLALVASFLLAVNPWHISVSRATSEVAISLFFALWGMYFLLKPKLALGVGFLVLSYFFYHSVRVLAPLFTLGMAISLRRKSLGVTAVVLGLVTLVLATNPEARGRFSQVSVFHDLNVQHELTRMPFEEGPGKVFTARLFHNKLSVYSRRLIDEYVKYFSADFFLGQAGRPGRYRTIGIGLVTYVELALLVLGVVMVLQKKANPLPLVLLMLAPVAAALTTEDAPNLHRAFYMIPFAVTLEAYGLSLIWKYRKIAVVLLTLNLIFFLHMYFVHAKFKVAGQRNYGARELATLVNENKSKYDRVILTNIPDDPYPWLAFFGKYDPRVFNAAAKTRGTGTWQFENLVFTGQRCPSRDAFGPELTEKILVVDATGCATESNLRGRADVEKVKQIIIDDESASEVYTIWGSVLK